MITKSALKLPSNVQGQPAAIILRASTAEQDLSPEDQRRMLASACHEAGCEIVQDYDIGHHTGAGILEDSAIWNAINDMRNGDAPYQVLLAENMSRATRNITMTVMLVNVALARGVRLLGLGDGFDSSQQGATLFAAIKGEQNAEFLRTLSRNVYAHMLEGHKLGRSTGAATFGYRGVPVYKDPANPVPRDIVYYRHEKHPENAQIVLAVFIAYAAGESLGKLARDRGWLPQAIKRMLGNPRYVGRWTWGRTCQARDQLNARKKLTKLPEADWLEVPREDLRIIPDELWQKVQDRRRREGVAGRPTGTGRTPSLLSGIFRCASCESKFLRHGTPFRRTRDGRQTENSSLGCYTAARRGPSRCTSGMISEPRVQAAVVSALQARLRQPELVERYVTRCQARVAARQGASAGDRAARISEIDAQIARAKRRIDSLVNAIADGGELVSLKPRLRAVEQELRTLEIERKAAQADTKPVVLTTPQEARAYVEDLLGTLTANPKRGHGLLRTHLKDAKVSCGREGTRRTFEFSGLFDLAPIMVIGGRSVRGGGEGNSTGGGRGSGPSGGGRSLPSSGGSGDGDVDGEDSVGTVGSDTPSKVFGNSSIGLGRIRKD